MMQTVRTMPLAELRARVEEAEKLLRVAKQLARDELSDPQQSSRARDRIGSIVSEVQGMFPGLGEPEVGGLDEPRPAGAGALGSAAATGQGPGEDEAAAAAEGDPEEERGDTDVDEDPDEDAEGDDAGDDAGDDDGWELDCDRLKAALANDALMAQIPEPERPRFRAMAERLLEVHERGELYSRILGGFEELAEVTRAGAEAVQRHLAALLTFGGPAALTELRGLSQGECASAAGPRGAVADAEGGADRARSGPGRRPKYKA